MAKATGGMPLEHSTRGDVISVGWKPAAERRPDANRRPIIECIQGLDRGRSLGVKSALERDANGWTGYDYLLGMPTSGPKSLRGHAGGGFMQLECMEDGTKAVDLLQPVYDLCLRLPYPRIWYDQPWLGHCSRGEYTIEEPRAVFSIEKYDSIFGRCERELAGAYYPSRAKIRKIIENLTNPETGMQMDVRGMLDLRRMLEYDSFCISTHPGRTNDGENWDLAQDNMVARVIWYMRNNPWLGTDWAHWLEIAGPLDMPKDRPYMNKLGMLSTTDASKLLIPVLRLLKADDSLHLVGAEMSTESYLNHIWGRDRPDKGQTRTAEVML